jgi:hypothetical protein
MLLKNGATSPIAAPLSHAKAPVFDSILIGGVEK